jgi:hypothetical protein
MAFPSWWLLQNGVIAFAAQAVVAITIIAILLRTRTRTRATWLLIGFFAATLGHSVTFTLNAAIYGLAFGGLIGAIEICSLHIGMIFLTRFAYAFPRQLRTFAREENVVVAIVIVFGGVAGVVGSIHIFKPSNELYAILVALLALEVLGLLFISWRRTVYFSIQGAAADAPGFCQRNRFASALLALVRPAGKDAHACRAFTLTFMGLFWPALWAVLFFTVLQSVMPVATYRLCLNLFILLFI